VSRRKTGTTPARSCPASAWSGRPPALRRYRLARSEGSGRRRAPAAARRAIRCRPPHGGSLGALGPSQRSTILPTETTATTSRSRPGERLQGAGQPGPDLALALAASSRRGKAVPVVPYFRCRPARIWIAATAGHEQATVPRPPAAASPVTGTSPARTRPVAPAPRPKVPTGTGAFAGTAPMASPSATWAGNCFTPHCQPLAAGDRQARYNADRATSGANPG
jgi:hypothetical protein